MTAQPSLLVVAAFSRHAGARAWARRRLEEIFGPVALASEPFPFTQTDYYRASMGPDLGKELWAFRDLLPPDGLPDAKRRALALEAELAAARTYPESRPVNLDPGLLLLGKFVLATTKDQCHRVYLGGGVFAEVTLRFHDGVFEPWPWTYPDYRLPEVARFLTAARDFYRRRLHADS